ncbi:hypothetical protein [Bdellovibrio sp. BCCA]|uniref:hypothetical protein n=1 Tax=Bdellovibrio sp. BCCA TaxID=3136281 RepID=UPI0030F0E5D3
MKINLLFAVLVATALGACNYNHVKKENAAMGGGLGKQEAMIAASLDYQSLNMAVIGPECLRCHSTPGGVQGGLNLETYQQVRANLSRIYYRSIEKRDMPSGGLGAAQYDLLKAWIEAGGPERNTGRGNARPIKGPINWPVIKNQVLKSSCLDCHRGANADAGLDFESLDVVRKNIGRIFDSAIVKQTMPLEPYGALTEAEKQALMKWISQGMPE